MKLKYTKIITKIYEIELDDDSPYCKLDNDTIIKNAEWEENNWSKLISENEMITNVERIENQCEGEKNEQRR